MSNQENSSKIKIVQGRVVSDKMAKTSVILVESARQHPLFNKHIKRSRKVHVHDEQNDCKMGDLVQAVETRPLSKLKHHRLYKILERAK